MIETLRQLLQGGVATASEMFPALPAYARGLPAVTDADCTDCGACAAACPTQAISVANARVALDLGKCVACGGCVAACSTGTIRANHRTDVATETREALVLTNAAPAAPRQGQAKRASFYRSIHIRTVSTGDSASDLEWAAANNPIFDASRFGIHVVASPRFADALVVTGPVPRAMHEPLMRCFDAMARPRIAIAVGAAAISGAPFSGGYAEANGLGALLPVAAFVPGYPPHPWYILHGILLAMGRL